MALNYDDSELIPVVVQDVDTGAVLMVAWGNEYTLKETVRTGFATFWSRSRQEVWVKGATSGNTMPISEIRVDCDSDTLLFLVHPNGPACHTGNTTCFYRTLEEALD